jgi:hypothetical protein
VTPPASTHSAAKADGAATTTSGAATVVNPKIKQRCSNHTATPIIGTRCRHRHIGRYTDTAAFVPASAPAQFADPILIKRRLLPPRAARRRVRAALRYRADRDQRSARAPQPECRNPHGKHGRGWIPPAHKHCAADTSESLDLLAHKQSYLHCHPRPNGIPSPTAPPKTVRASPEPHSVRGSQPRVAGWPEGRPEPADWRPDNAVPGRGSPPWVGL